MLLIQLLFALLEQLPYLLLLLMSEHFCEIAHTVGCSGMQSTLPPTLLLISEHFCEVIHAVGCPGTHSTLPPTHLSPSKATPQTTDSPSQSRPKMQEVTRHLTMPPLNPKLYTVALIAPLEIEALAVLALFDEEHEGDFALARGHDYVFSAGKIFGHNVVLATLPLGQPYGTGSAAALASQVKMFFPNLWFGLLVGVAAGLPDFSRSPPRDIRLGDVLVALPEGDSAGLIAYDLGRVVGENTIQLLHGGHVLAKTEMVIRSAIGKIKRKAPKDTEAFLPYYHQIQNRGHTDGTFVDGMFVDPGQDQDILYELGNVVDRPRRPDDKRTRVWYGPIGSGEKLMRDAARRNELRDRYGIIGLEMEAAGTMNTIPVGVIRGVCDYADNHKNKDWQSYAAAMAAAYAKAILKTIPPKQTQGE